MSPTERGGEEGPYKLHAPSTDASCVAKSSFFKSFLSFALNSAYPAGVSARINMDMVGDLCKNAPACPSVVLQAW